MTMLKSAMEERAAVSAYLLSEGDKGSKAFGWVAGKGECVSITVYMESGHYGYVPYLRILKTDGSTTHVAASMFAVTFAKT